MKRRFAVLELCLGITFLLCATTACASMVSGIQSVGNQIADAVGTGQNSDETATPSPESAPATPATNPAVAGKSDGRADPDAAHWDIAALDTAAEADYLTGVEKDVILEMNKARNNPKLYAELYIKPVLNYNWGGPFGDKSYLAPGATVYTSTQEGKSAVNSCITAMNSAKSTGVLAPDKGISLAAKDHALDQSKTGQTGHTGSDGSDPFERMKRYGGGYNTAGENCAYGADTGRDIVVQFLIDDGVPSRGHRKNIMNTAFTQAGVSVQTHPQYRHCCVIDYANGFVDK